MGAVSRDVAELTDGHVSVLECSLDLLVGSGGEIHHYSRLSV